MVTNAYYYAVPLIGAALLPSWMTRPLWALPLLILAGFFLWFFRDPDRVIPDAAGAIVSPADGKVTDVSPAEDSSGRSRISIFLSVIDVHVNRSPIEGVIREVVYQKGKFRNAMGSASAEQNEQNIVTVEGAGQTGVVKEIAGLRAVGVGFIENVE